MTQDCSLTFKLVVTCVFTSEAYHYPIPTPAFNKTQRKDSKKT